MNEAQWSGVEAGFDALREISPERRPAALAAIEDDEIRREVASLLVHADGGATITSVVGAMAARMSGPDPEGKRLGPYRLLRRLGQGGQGAVFEAVRDDGTFRQRVAIKVVKWEMDTEEARGRFRRERQILAGLEHPHIARLLDGGETPEGVPYLAMEFVDGLPLTAATAGWPQRRKLEIFLEIAAAVAFAHRNLIVHRDLKPANIMVTGDGAPKLLDFGIARLLDGDAQRTQTGFQALTPEYASPEQVLGEPITTACDVYSLGIVLYELLTGRRPYEVPTHSPVEIHKAVCLTEPKRPGLSGDLDNILLMAMRKEPARRYPSVEQFAQDIRSAMEYRPVAARGDSFAYRTGRFVRRNVLALAASGAVLLAAGVGTAVALQQARIAGERFQQVRRLAHSFVFDYNDELARVQGNTAVREKMVRTALEYLDTLSRGAGNDIDLQKELAAAYQRVGDAQGFPTRPNLGHADQALASYRKAAGIHERISVRDPQHRAESQKFYLDYAELLHLTGDYRAAMRIGELGLRNVLETAAAHPEDEKLQGQLAHAWCALGDINEESDHNRDALDKFRRCLNVANGMLKRTGSHLALIMAQGAQERVGTAATSAGHLDEALAAFDKDEELLNRLLGAEPANPRFLHDSAILAQFRSMVYYDDNRPNLNDPAQCLKYSRQYLEAERKLAERDPNDASSRLSYAIALFRLSYPLKETNPAAAVDSARESLKQFDILTAGGKRDFLVASRRGRALHRLAESLLAAGRPMPARDAAAQAMGEQRKAAARDAGDFQEAALLSKFLVTSAEIAVALRDRAATESFFAQAEHMAEGLYEKNPGDLTAVIPLARVCRELADYWKSVGDEAQAARYRERARSLWRDFPDHNDFVRRQLAALN